MRVSSVGAHSILGKPRAGQEPYGQLWVLALDGLGSTYNDKNSNDDSNGDIDDNNDWSNKNEIVLQQVARCAKELSLPCPMVRSMSRCRHASTS